MSEPVLMAAPFPKPASDVVEHFDRARRLARAEDPQRTDRHDLSLLQRPWDPPSCDSTLRPLIYAWLDEVVGWINEEHTWRTSRVVPPCWPEHPHIVHELAVVAALRWEAGAALTAGSLEEWHRFTLPQFLERIALRVGETGCPPERHQDRPGRTREKAYRSATATAQRKLRRQRDESAQPRQDF